MSATVKVRIAPMLNVIRSEYTEMPGMRLTRAQFQKLWTLDEASCAHAIERLISEGFLRQDRKGQLHRAVDDCV